MTPKVVGFRQAKRTGHDPQEQVKGQCPNGKEHKRTMSIGDELGQRCGLQPGRRTSNTRPRHLDRILRAKGDFRPGSNVMELVLWEDYFGICEGR